MFTFIEELCELFERQVSFDNSIIFSVDKLPALIFLPVPESQ